MLGALKSIEIPASVESIGAGAFSFNNWSSLETVTFAAGSKLKRIETFTFNYADKLKSIIIPSSVTSIGAGAFRLTTNLQSITIPSSVTRIETSNNQGPAFDMSGLKTVFFESSSSLTTFNVSIGPGKPFFGAKNVTISVVGQTEFTLTTGPITSLDITGVLTPNSYTNIIDVTKISKVSVGTYVTSIGGQCVQ